MRQSTRLVSNPKVELSFETFGNASAPAILLVMGNSAPGLVWPTAFCQQLAQRGFFVIRFDQRDTGLSTYFDFETQPYTLDDLVEDSLDLLTALNVQTAHVIGLSQGGVQAYRMALRAPERVATLTVMMSSPDLRPKNDAFIGAPPRPGELPRPAADYVAAVIALNATPTTNEQDAAIRFMENFRLAKGATSPFDEQAWMEMGLAVATMPRLRGDGESAKMANHSNHSRAQMATPPLTEDDLGNLHLPVLVLHGNQDPIFPVAHAEWAAEKIENAKLVIIEDMGHALDPAFFPPVLETITEFIGASQT